MKRILFLLVAMCFMVPMEGCRLPPPASMSVQEEGRQMKDSQGVEVTIPDHPCRIVSIGVSTDDILIPLVGTDRIAAISYLPPNLEKEAARIPGRISGTTESVISFHPDLVVAADWNSKDYKDYIEEIRAVGIPVYVYRTQKDVEGMIALIHTLGNVVNEDEKADCFAADTKKRLDALTSFTAALPRRDTAVFIALMASPAEREAPLRPCADGRVSSTGQRIGELWLLPEEIEKPWSVSIRILFLSPLMPIRPPAIRHLQKLIFWTIRCFLPFRR